MYHSLGNNDSSSQINKNRSNYSGIIFLITFLSFCGISNVFSDLEVRLAENNADIDNANKQNLVKNNLVNSHWNQNTIANSSSQDGKVQLNVGNNVYVVWVDDSNGPDSDIFFKSSNDSGKTFNPVIDLSNNVGNVGESASPYILASADNNVYVVWVDDSNGGDDDIFFRSSNDGGKTFNSVIDLSNNTEFSSLQQILTLHDNVYVMWNDFSNGLDADIFFRSSNDGGKTFNPFIDLSNNIGESIWPWSQILLLDDNVYVVWVDDSNGGDRDIFFRSSNDGGKTFNPVIDLSNNTNFSYAPQMLISPDNVYVMWVDESNGSDYDIFFRPSNDGGKTFNPFIDLSNNTSHDYDNSMIVSAGNVYILWEDSSHGGDGDIFFRSSNDGGKTFNPVIDLSNNVSPSGHGQIMIFDNNIYVLWGESGADDDIFFRSSNDGGKTFNPFIDLSNNVEESTSPKMLASADNNVYVMWVDESNGSDGDIFFRSSNDGGKTFNPFMDLSSNAGASAVETYPYTTLVSYGNSVYVVWVDQSNGGDRDIFFRSSNDGGKTFNPFIDLSNNVGESTSPKMLASADNNVYVVWVDDSNVGDRDIFFRSSNDGGKTFNPFIDLSNNVGESSLIEILVQ